MKKLLTAIFAVGLFSLGAIKAEAGATYNYWDFDWILQKVSPSNPYYGTFNIIPSGYNPAHQTVVSATAWFLLSDDHDAAEEYVVIDLGSVANYFGPIEVDFSLVGGPVTGSALLDLSADGVLSYTIRATSGDFWAKFAKLCATATPVAVPDGGMTVVLLGCAFVVVEALRRNLVGKHRA
jgi:hypothetical protein